MLDDRLVVTRAGGQVWACRGTRQRRVGAIKDLEVVSDRHVAYTRAGMVGVFDAVSGTRSELAGTQVAASGAQLLAAGPGGLRTPTAVLSADPASDPALGSVGDSLVAYWLDGAGTAHTQNVTA